MKTIVTVLLTVLTGVVLTVGAWFTLPATLSECHNEDSVNCVYHSNQHNVKGVDVNFYTIKVGNLFVEIDF